LVVWGAGELGGRVARRWVEAGGRAVGYTAGTSRHEALERAGVEARIGAAEIEPEDALLLALPGTDRQIMAVSTLGEAPARAVLVSSTGYYGLASGAVDEDTPPGKGERAQRIAAAEGLFRTWAPAGVVLRMGGLYRQGRGPLAAFAKRGRVPRGPPDKTLALIHYDDAATATLAALRHPAPRPAYNCVVAPCPTRGDFYQAAAVVNELELPVFDVPLGRPPAIFDTTRTREDLLPEPERPSWQAALVP